MSLPSTSTSPSYGYPNDLLDHLEEDMVNFDNLNLEWDHDDQHVELFIFGGPLSALPPSPARRIAKRTFDDLPPCPSGGAILELPEVEEDFDFEVDVSPEPPIPSIEICFQQKYQQPVILNPAQDDCMDVDPICERSPMATRFKLSDIPSKVPPLSKRRRGSLRSPTVSTH